MSRPEESAIQRLQVVQKHLHSLPRSQRLKDKVAIITGAASGIGRATAVTFANAGVKALYLLDLGADKFPSLQAELKEKYPDVLVSVTAGDASDEKTIAQLCQKTLDDHGRLDIFFANAGILGPNRFQTLDEATLMRQYKINTVSCFFGIKYGTAAMRQLGGGKTRETGSVILTASVAGMRGGGGGFEYTVSKAAVANMAAAAVNNLQGTEIRVNSLAPGFTRTGMTEFAFHKQPMIEKIDNLIPMRRSAAPEEVSQAVLFLASDESSYITGIVLPVDGGMSSTVPFAPDAGRFNK
ncbi:NAD-binding protein [Atractiella rhizophila]|nr:NAD-binding protein [Atractiella rhizophila]